MRLFGWRNLATTAATVYKSCGFFMAQAQSPQPIDPVVDPQPVGTVTHMVVAQRPLGEFARGSYVWPAWAVLLLVLGTLGLVVGTRVRDRRNRKQQRE